MSDRQQIVTVMKAMQDAINRRDAARLCTTIYAFQGSTTTKQCVARLQPALERSTVRVKIEVIRVRRDGSRATVSARTTGLSRRSGPQRQIFTLVREGGQWRVLYE